MSALMTPSSKLYSEIVGKGLIARNRLSTDLSTEFETDLAKIGMPKWYIEYLKKLSICAQKHTIANL